MKFIYRGRLIQLKKEKRTLPGGRRAEIEVIEHPGAALIVPFLDNKTIVLVHQYRPVIQKAIYELPAGTLNENETPLACARREIMEETGFRAGVIRKLGMIYPVPGYSTEKIHLFKAEKLVPCPTAFDEDEVIRVEKFSRNRVRRFFNGGKITDAKTICALTFCGWL